MEAISWLLFMLILEQKTWASNLWSTLSNLLHIYYLQINCFLTSDSIHAVINEVILLNCLFIYFWYKFIYFNWRLITLQYLWFCHTSTWIHHGCTRVPHLEPPSHLPSYTIPLGHPRAPAPSTLYHASNLDNKLDMLVNHRDFLSLLLWNIFNVNGKLCSC